MYFPILRFDHFETLVYILFWGKEVIKKSKRKSFQRSCGIFWIPLPQIFKEDEKKMGVRTFLGQFVLSKVKKLKHTVQTTKKNQRLNFFVFLSSVLEYIPSTHSYKKKIPPLARNFFSLFFCQILANDCRILGDTLLCTSPTLRELRPPPPL